MIRWLIGRLIRWLIGRLIRSRATGRPPQLGDGLAGVLKVGHLDRMIAGREILAGAVGSSCFHDPLVNDELPVHPHPPAVVNRYTKVEGPGVEVGIARPARGEVVRRQAGIGRAVAPIHT